MRLMTGSLYTVCDELRIDGIVGSLPWQRCRLIFYWGCVTVSSTEKNTLIALDYHFVGY